MKLKELGVHPSNRSESPYKRLNVKNENVYQPPFLNFPNPMQTLTNQDEGSVHEVVSLNESTL